jgi:hypothetical protein
LMSSCGRIRWRILGAVAPSAAPHDEAARLVVGMHGLNEP